jgi:hypothetical protein
MLGEEVYKRLWKLLKMKHEKPCGALSYEVEEALSYSHLARPEIREEFARKVPVGEAVTFRAFTEPPGGSDLGVTGLLDVKARLER